MDYIQVDIIGLSTSPSSGGAYALVLGEVGGTRRLPIIIGGFEAQAIALQLEKIQPPRPMTHDLLRDALDAVGAEVLDVLVDELLEGTFYAKIRYTHGGTESQLDARPSDAIALSVRVDVPIFVSPDVLEEAGIPAEEDDDALVPSETAERTPRPDATPLERMQAELDEAIAAEDYERAATLRDEIQRMQGEN